MNEKKRATWWKYALGAGVTLVIAVAIAFAYVLSTGLLDRWTRVMIIDQLGKATGARVELGHFHFAWLPLSAKFDGLTLHGLEPEGTPPLFHADTLRVEIRVESFWGKKISLGSVEMSNFSAHVRVESNGSTNFPGPSISPGSQSASLQRLFDLQIAKLQLEKGELLWNDTRVPLVAQGDNFEFAMDYARDAGGAAYLGRVSWRQFDLAVRRFLPFASDFSAKFILRPRTLSITQAQWKIPHSQVEAQADLSSFSHGVWSFRYRAQTNLEDVQTILRKPKTPSGNVDFTGDGRYADGQVNVSGRYIATNLAMNDRWFHTSEMSSHGSYHFDQHGLDVPDLEAQVFSGTLTGSLHLDLSTQRFRFESHGRGWDLSRVLDAENNPSLPVDPLHWAGTAGIDAVTTWQSDFKNLDSQGVMTWAYPSSVPRGQIPASARLDYHYEMIPNQVIIAPSEITTPTSHLAMHGTLGETNSALDVTLDTQDLATWDDFINRLRGEHAEPQRIAGQFHWQGNLTGPLLAPTFSGYATGTEARYAQLYWDELAGQITYSQDQLHIVRGRARLGGTTADLELYLDLDEWSFAPYSQWTLDVTTVGANPADIQKLLGTSFPVNGILGAQFHAQGTRAAPEYSGMFDLAAATAFTWRLDRARGAFSLRDGDLRVTNAEIRLPARVPGVPAGLATGNLEYQMNTSEVTFDLTGAGIPLEGIQKIQTPHLPVAGLVNFQLRGQGPLLAPQAHGTVRLIDLKLGNEVVGSFDGNVNSDGRHVSATVGSAMSTGRLSAKIDLDLGGDYPLTGDVTAEQIDFDPLIVTALHLPQLTGHSRIDGHFAVSGSAARPETIAVQADLSRVTLDYNNVLLENNGPIRLTYSGAEVRVDQASLRGADTDFRVTGFARFMGDRAINLRVNGAVSLQLVATLLPPMQATGRAQVNTSITGTVPAPRINGSLHVEGASLRYGDFPAGFSNLTGDFNFDTTRVVLSNVSAESGGGRLAIDGAMDYGTGTLNYTLNLHGNQVRVRYPVGMSWLADGNLRLSGTTQGATLSGRVTVSRLLMAQGFDLASFVISSKEPEATSGASSSFLRNLQFDIEADSGPDARLEWAGANFQTDATLRLRGTWTHPILLGHIHLLSGQMTFRGNRYTIQRGDIDFANPFRLDPVLNVEATTTIQQYEVTLDFTGPASRLNLAYRSDPPLPSSDVISLLALGQPGGESAERTVTGNSQLGASAVLSEAISNELGGRIQRLFGISNFHLGPAVNGPTAPQQNSLASVTIEQQVTPQLVVTYTTNVTSTAYEIIQIEYAVTRDLSVVALRDENGTFGIDVIRKTRFK